MIWQFFWIPILNSKGIILVCFQQESQSLVLLVLISFLLVCWIRSCLYDFLFIFLSLFWQDYSSAWRIPSGTSMEIATLWNYLKNLSHHMLRVEWRRWQRETLKYWEMSKVNFRPRTKVLMQSSASLFLIITYVNFIVPICIWHI